MVRDGFVQGIVDESGFARAGDAGDTGQAADRQFKGHVFQIVAARALDDELFFLVKFETGLWGGYFFLARQILAGQ